MAHIGLASPGRLRIACALLTVAASTLLAATPPEPVTPPEGPSSSEHQELATAGPLVVGGASPDLVLLFTGGVVGYVAPCG
ncbi:MAG TPA: hypothetical protein VFG76_09880 [Candidatus Polarisedimenticolia bacterium]|nr:hypothetical protein [Candidatus Polarisedimenticolia bacterium]